MARSSLRDPVDRFRWTVDIPGFSRFGFSACTTPEFNLSVKSYAEGGRHLTPLKIVDGASYKPVTLTRGVTNDTSFLKWASAPFDLASGNAGLPENPIQNAFQTLVNQINPFNSVDGTLVPFSSEYPFTYRHTVSIKHLDRVGQTIAIYVLYNAFISSYKPASDFDAAADGEVSLESMTLEYESFETRSPGLAGIVSQAIAAI